MDMKRVLAASLLFWGTAVRAADERGPGYGLSIRHREGARMREADGTDMNIRLFQIRHIRTTAKHFAFGF